MYLATPALALVQVRLETPRLGKQVGEIGVETGTASINGTAEDLDAVTARSLDNQHLYDAINDYLRQLSKQELTPAETRRPSALAAIAGHIQNVGETNAVNLVAIGRERLASGATFGEETVQRARVLANKMREASVSRAR